MTGLGIIVIRIRLDLEPLFILTTAVFSTCNLQGIVRILLVTAVPGNLHSPSMNNLLMMMGKQHGDSKSMNGK